MAKPEPQPGLKTPLLPPRPPTPPISKPTPPAKPVFTLPTATDLAARKKGLGARSWLRLDSQGNSQLLEADKVSPGTAKNEELGMGSYETWPLNCRVFRHGLGCSLGGRRGWHIFCISCRFHSNGLTKSVMSGSAIWRIAGRPVVNVTDCE